MTRNVISKLILAMIRNVISKLISKAFLKYDPMFECVCQEMSNYNLVINSLNAKTAIIEKQVNWFASLNHETNAKAT